MQELTKGKSPMTHGKMAENEKAKNDQWKKEEQKWPLKIRKDSSKRGVYALS